MNMNVNTYPLIFKQTTGKRFAIYANDIINWSETSCKEDYADSGCWRTREIECCEIIFKEDEEKRSIYVSNDFDEITEMINNARRCINE